MEIIALQEYTDKTVSLYEGEIRNINKEIADRLIEKGIVAEHKNQILPPVTNDDNGKILSVVNGAWTKTENSGSSGSSSENSIEFCKIEFIDNDGDCSCNKTYSEILQLMNKGNVIFITVNRQNSIIWNVNFSSTTGLWFSYTERMGGSSYVQYANINSSNYVTCSYHTIKQ